MVMVSINLDLEHIILLLPQPPHSFMPLSPTETQLASAKTLEKETIIQIQQLL